jgi:hypothetical protein
MDVFITETVYETNRSKPSKTRVYIGQIQVGPSPFHLVCFRIRNVEPQHQTGLIYSSGSCRERKSTPTHRHTVNQSSIPLIYNALITSVDVTKCCTETQTKTPKSTVARKNFLERQEPRKKPREDLRGCPVLFWLCRWKL